MTAHELARLLLAEKDIDVRVFADGKLYSPLVVAEFEGVVDVGCGWGEVGEGAEKRTS